MLDTTNSLSSMLGTSALDLAKAKIQDSVGNGTFQATLDKAVASGEDQKLLEACQQFEGVFLDQMLQIMRSTVPENGFWGDSTAMKIFQDMQDEQLSKDMSRAGGMGLGEMLYQQLKPKGKVVSVEEALANSKGRSSTETQSAAETQPNPKVDTLG